LTGNAKALLTVNNRFPVDKNELKGQVAFIEKIINWRTP